MCSFSECALRMSRLSARLIGQVPRPTDSKAMKVAKLFREPPLAKKKETYDWYPDHNTYTALTGTLRFLGLYRDEHQDFKDEQKLLKKLREKGKPKEGEGKRAAKKGILLVPQEGEFLPQWQREESAFIAFPYVGGMSSNEMKVIWWNTIISWLKSIPVKLRLVC
ncbi:28S ribosomal protein S33, mitochondrial-like [Piliocolobus tephrosceles]|uniref:Small ribosomal subunit protein mS33 n=1 Tax=Piliocolobus tephrosceles TaxID=591936 RepID=A0A8C9I768_9PRIM|nr:28S ribosomal protein S33, mitochondrial-like [Piliocolobus tephrosceles]